MPIKYIGSGFVGFIYSFALWQTAITFTPSQYDTCGVGLASTCLQPCDITQYYNPYQAQCASCDNSCTNGCGTWGTCSTCEDLLCSTCISYNIACTADLASIPCITGLLPTPTQKCCDPICEDCSGPSSQNCLSCTAGYLLGDTCVSGCPLGFSMLRSTCLMNVNPLFQ